ncbi:MAG TPA: alpha/beta fold hydrolase [Bryobacteraceae bacterium]
MPRIIETLLLDGPAGKLEAMLEAPEDAAPRELALVCHPHPLHGGTMHNKVVYRLARALRRNGAAVLRFNFRGVGRSEGHYDKGIGEIEDARAALAWLRLRYPGLPYTLAGFSFGSRVVLSLGCEGDGAGRLIAAGLPTRFGAIGLRLACRTPKFIVQSTHDQYGPPEELEKLFREFAEPKSLIWIQASDHFFAGALDVFEDAVFRLGPAEAIGKI